MLISRYLWQWTFSGLLCLAACVAAAQDEDAPPPPALEVLISVADQKLVLLRDGGLIAKYPISTSRFGAGDSYGSYKTPLGKLRVYDKIGEDLSPGAVIKHRSATGEVISANAPGRDPIVTRVIWLEGTEEQNANARARGIYIHGTPVEGTIGRPVSWGCIRMRSEDVIALYNQVPVGTEVDILADHLPHLHKYKPPQPPEPDGDQPPSGFLAKLLPWSNVKQTSTNPPPAPPAAEKPVPVVEKTAPVAEKPVPVPEKPAPEKVASHPAPPRSAPVAVFRESNSGDTQKDSSSSDAWRALQGSVLLADLPPPSFEEGVRRRPALANPETIAAVEFVNRASSFLSLQAPVDKHAAML